MAAPVRPGGRVPATTDPTAARTLLVEGVVQGVGFRPFVWRLATELGLAGRVRNAAGVVVGMRRAVSGLSGVLPEAPPKLRATSLPKTWQQIMVSASHWVGFTLPGMMELPGSFSGRLSSPRPLRGPEASQRMSLAIFMSAAASVFSAPCAATSASCAASAANLLSATA